MLIVDIDGVKKSKNIYDLPKTLHLPILRDPKYKKPNVRNPKKRTNSVGTVEKHSWTIETEVKEAKQLLRDNIHQNDSSISSLLFKYIERKEMYEKKGIRKQEQSNKYNTTVETYQIDPKWQRNYRKRMNKERNLPNSRFLLFS